MQQNSLPVAAGVSAGAHPRVAVDEGEPVEAALTAPTPHHRHWPRRCLRLHRAVRVQRQGLAGSVYDCPFSTHRIGRACNRALSQAGVCSLQKASQGQRCPSAKQRIVQVVQTALICTYELAQIQVGAEP